MTHTERTEARIVEIRKSDKGMFPERWAVEALARELAAKLDKLESRIRLNNSRGIDCDVRDDLLETLKHA